MYPQFEPCVIQMYSPTLSPPTQAQVNSEKPMKKVSRQNPAR